MADDGHIMSHVLKLLCCCAAWKRKQDTDVQTDCWQIIDLREIFIKEPRPAGFNGPLKFYRLFNSCFNARWVLGSHVLKHSLGSSPSASSGESKDADIVLQVINTLAQVGILSFSNEVSVLSTCSVTSSKTQIIASASVKRFSQLSSSSRCTCRSWAMLPVISLTTSRCAGSN